MNAPALESLRLQPRLSNLNATSRPVGFLWAALLTILGIGCSKEPANVRPSDLGYVFVNLSYAMQETHETKEWQIEKAIDLTNGKKQFGAAKIQVTRYAGNWNPPTTMDYFGSECDKFYMDRDQSKVKCFGNQIGLDLDEEYAGRWKIDTRNTWGVMAYQLVVIDQDVVKSLYGFLAGATSPREDSDSISQRCSFVFDQQIRAWLNDTRDTQQCGYSDGGRQDYCGYIVNWIVGHELGRQIGLLHAIDDPLSIGEHKSSLAAYDYMRQLDECEPIMLVNIPRISLFCADNDTIKTNSCVDLLKRKFSVP